MEVRLAWDERDELDTMLYPLCNLKPLLQTWLDIEFLDFQSQIIK